MTLNFHFLWKVYSELIGFPVLTEMPLVTSGQNEIKYTVFEETGENLSPISPMS